MEPVNAKEYIEEQFEVFNFFKKTLLEFECFVAKCEGYKISVIFYTNENLHDINYVILYPTNYYKTGVFNVMTSNVSFRRYLMNQIKDDVYNNILPHVTRKISIVDVYD